MWEVFVRNEFYDCFLGQLGQLCSSAPEIGLVIGGEHHHIGFWLRTSLGGQAILAPGWPQFMGNWENASQNHQSKEQKKSKSLQKAFKKPSNLHKLFSLPTLDLSCLVFAHPVCTALSSCQPSSVSTVPFIKCELRTFHYHQKCSLSSLSSSSKDFTSVLLLIFTGF